MAREAKALVPSANIWARRREEAAPEIHLGSASQIAAVRADLRRRKSGWLAEAAAHMADTVQKDWRTWCQEK